MEKSVEKTRQNTRSKRQSAALKLGPLFVDKDEAKSIRQQLYEGLRDGILTGRLLPGGLLPSTRVLASDLNISRNTVMAVFELLIAEGLIVTTVGSGTRITQSIPSEFLALARSRSQLERTRSPGLRPISRRAGEMASFLDSRAHSVPKPFAPGVPAIDQFPIATWNTITSRHWREATIRDLCSPQSLAAPELRQAIASYVGASRAALCGSGSIVVVSGAQQALDLTARVLSDPGDVCWMEEPGYRGARYALQLAGLNLVPARVDDQGLDIDYAIKNLPKPRLIYVTPSHQYPLGGMMSLERRIKLLQFAESIGAWVIEDDYDSEYAYSGVSVPCLQGLDAGGRTVYIGTFNKALFPGLRLGFLISPSDLVEAFRGSRMHTDGHPPAVVQSILAEFIQSGTFSAHLRRMRGIYAERRDELIKSLCRYMPYLRIGINDRGLHFVAELPKDASDRAWSAKAQAEGFVLPPLSEFYFGDADRQGLLFGFACTPIQEIEPAVRKLSAVLKP